MSRSINDLRPEFRDKVRSWDIAMALADLDYLITCTTRTGAQQDGLWEIGRTVMGEHPSPEHPMGLVRTNAKAGQSAHQYGLAIDFVIMVHGKPHWSGDSPAWDKAIELAEARGMQSLRPMESAHLQDPNWKQLAAETKI